MKEKLLNAMYLHVAKQGYEKTSLSQIASAVSIQKPSIYYHFKSKEDLFFATVQKYYHDLYHISDDTLKNITTPQAFSDFFHNIGTITLAEFEKDEILQQFYCEVNLQSRRLPALEKILEGYDEEISTQLKTFLEIGVTLGCLPKNTNISLESETITALLIGLSEMLLYRIKANCSGIWENHVNRLLSQ